MENHVFSKQVLIGMDSSREMEDEERRGWTEHGSQRMQDSSLMVQPARIKTCNVKI